MFGIESFRPESELIVIRSYQGCLEADPAKSVLEAAGIESMIRGAGVSRRYRGLAVTGSIELLVQAEDAEDAERILDLDDTRGDDEE